MAKGGVMSVKVEGKLGELEMCHTVAGWKRLRLEAVLKLDKVLCPICFCNKEEWLLAFGEEHHCPGEF